MSSTASQFRTLNALHKHFVIFYAWNNTKGWILWLIEWAVSEFENI